MSVVALPASGLAHDNAGVAARLRMLADDIEAGDYGAVSNAITVIESDPTLWRFVCGKPCDIARAVGLLQIAICDMCRERRNDDAE